MILPQFWRHLCCVPNSTRLAACCTTSSTLTASVLCAEAAPLGVSGSCRRLLLPPACTATTSINMANQVISSLAHAILKAFAMLLRSVPSKVLI
jgi:hypothetical protein